MMLQKILSIEKKIFVLLILFTYVTSNYAQENLDSLHYYLDRIENNNKSSFDSLSKLYQKASSFATPFMQVKLLTDEALLFQKKGMYNSSKNDLLKAISLSETNNLKVSEGKCYIELSSNYYGINQKKQSYKALLNSKTILENLTLEELEKYNTLNTSNDTQEGLLLPVIFNLGALAVDFGHFNLAEKYYFESLSLSEKNNSKQDIIDSKINLANLLYEKGDFLKSEISFLRILKENELNENDYIYIYYNLAMIYIELGDYDKALDYINQTEEIAIATENNLFLIDIDFVKAKIYLNTNKLSLAKKTLKAPLQASRKIEDYNYIKKIYELLIKINIKTKKYKDADSIATELFKLQDSLENETNKNAYNEIFFENELHKQSKINLVQKYRLNLAKKQSNFYFWTNILGILLLISLIGYIAIYRENRRKQDIITTQIGKMKMKEIENKRKIDAINNKRVQENLNTKKRELLQIHLNSKRRIEKFKDIIKRIDHVKEKSVITKTDLLQLKNHIKKTEKELIFEKDIQTKINEIHKEFFTKILDDFPKLTKNELKILAYLRVDLSSKEIAEIQFVSIDAIRKTRHRIRKKLQLEPTESLEKYILKYA